MSGPLAGTRVVELAAIGPAPFGVMLLADLGAEVIRVDRVAAARGEPGLEETMRGLSRNRRSIAVDLRSAEGRDIVLDLVAGADVLVEGMRPGVAERLGVGPGDCSARNGRLIYARMTGWGQEGPMSHLAGHDIDYAAIAGALHPMGRQGEPPAPPLNLVADFGGGGTYLAIGVLAALVERATSGQGQVVDAAMVDGAASLTAMFHGLMAMNAWSTERQSNLLDGGAPFYDTYACEDGGFVAVGALEPQFYAELLERLGLDGHAWPQNDRTRWPSFRAELERIFGERPRDHWAELFADSDACVAPLLSLAEAPQHAHNVARGVFVEVDGVAQPAPAPRLSRTPGEVRSGAPDYGADTRAVLDELGYDEARVAALVEAGVVA